jgi:two-component system NtrC family sensor kinase
MSPTTQTPSASQLLEGLLELSRELDLGQDEGALAMRYVRVLGGLLPGREVVIRLLRDGKLVVHARQGARLAPAAQTLPLELRASALRKTGVGEAPVRAGLVRPIDVPAPVTAAGRAGLSIPLVARGTLLGTLDVAYGSGADPLAIEDEPMLIPVANHLSVAIGHVRLHAETVFLRDYLAQVIDHAGALIMGVDPAWRITIYNKPMAELTGRDPSQVMGTNLLDLVPEDQRGAIEKVFAEASAGRPTLGLEITHRAASGAPITTVWTVTRLAVANRAEAVIAVGQDRTRIESLQRQVIQAEKLATLGQLATGVVHEINNPLTSVSVYAEYLLRKLEKARETGTLGPFEPADADKLRRIVEGAARIQNLSRDLVRYGRPDDDDAEGSVSINDIVRQAVVFCEHLSERHACKVEVELAPALPPITGVRSQLQQVLINLLTNAAHAMREGGGRVRVITRAVSSAVALIVEDDGRGIPAGTLERIFEPFFTTKTGGQGTGLGLSIVQRIVERHHGRIRVESTEGRGTTFEITLPTAL